MIRYMIMMTNSLDTMTLHVTAVTQEARVSLALTSSFWAWLDNTVRPYLQKKERERNERRGEEERGGRKREERERKRKRREERRGEEGRGGREKGKERTSLTPRGMGLPFRC